MNETAIRRRLDLIIGLLLVSIALRLFPIAPDAARAAVLLLLLVGTGVLLWRLNDAFRL
ncbi:MULTISPECIES: hypothetical protein [Natrialba]|uniref:hypothetical protein n=1 Tax=Natrialba TaxID=63742 RepID=UPI000A9CBD45|nr:MULTISPECIES: hypothetical protein [Natrialba]